MTQDFLTETIEKVTDWTEGRFLAERTFYSKSNLFCIVIKPFTFPIGNGALIACAEEGYVPEDIYLFFDKDPMDLAKKVRRFVVYDLKYNKD